MITEDSAEGPFYHQEWHGMNPTTPIISGGMNALRMPGFFENLGHSNLIMTAGGGAFGHVDGGAAGAMSLRQAEQCWKAGADPDRFRQGAQRIRPRLRELPARRRHAVPGLARQARQGRGLSFFPRSATSRRSPESAARVAIDSRGHSPMPEAATH